MEKIKVLRIMHRVNVGGPTYHAGYLTKYLNDSRFETLLISGNIDSLEKSGEYILDTIGVKPIFVKNMYRPLHPVKDYKAYREIRRIIKEFEPDIVHTHAAKSGALGRLAAISCKVPIIVHTFHGHVFHSYFGKLKTRLYLEIERFLAKKSSKIIAISQLQKNELVNEFSIDKAEKFQVVPLGFDLERYQIDKETKRNQFRKEFSLDEKTIAIGIVGRLASIKNHYLFLKGLEGVLKHTTAKVRAFIIGDGEERKNLEAYAIDLGISFTTEHDKIHDKPLCFTSWRSDIDIVNAGLDIMTLTSLNEGTPVSLIEAQAANLPIIATNVGGVRDVVLENQTALIVDSDNEEQFTNQLLKCVENKALREQLSEKGYSHAVNNFSRQKLVENICRLYESLIEESKILSNKWKKI